MAGLEILRRRERYHELLMQRHLRIPVPIVVERKNPFHIYDDREFLQRYRFTKETTIHIIDQLRPALERRTASLTALPVYLQVLAAMRFYAVGSFQLMHGDEATLSQPSLSRIIGDVSTQLAMLRPTCISFPTPAQQRRTAAQFREYCGFPGVVGAWDCTNIHIRNPGGENARRFLNRKNRSSVNVQAVCNHDGMLIDIVARWPGGTHDSRIFRESGIKRRLEGESHEHKWLLGDSGYACQPYLMTPLLHPDGRGDTQYNRSQIRGRNVIERTFGMMKRRFPCLNELRLKLETTFTVIVAVGVLWNLSLLHEEPDVEGPVPEGPGPVDNPEADLLPDGVNGEHLAGQLRRRWLIEHHFT